MAALVREVVGDVLRGARMSQGRTLREVSDSARVSLGYLSEIERGRKEPSSELLSAICTALQLPLSVVLIDAGERMARQERLARATRLAEQPAPPLTPAPRSSLRRWCRWRWPKGRRSVRVDKMRAMGGAMRADPIN